MTNAVTKHTHEVPKGSNLARKELELLKTMTQHLEAFCHQGAILESIRVEKDYLDAGYHSFEQYMNERKPCGIKKAQAYKLIRAAKTRAAVDSFSPNGESSPQQWTEWTIRPLTHKDITPKSLKVIAGRIAKRLEKGEPLTAKLVKEVRDKYTGADKKRDDERYASGQSPAQVIDSILDQVHAWKVSLGTVPEEFWEAADSEDKGIAKRTAKALRELAAQLRSA